MEWGALPAWCVNPLMDGTDRERTGQESKGRLRTASHRQKAMSITWSGELGVPATPMKRVGMQNVYPHTCPCHGTTHHETRGLTPIHDNPLGHTLLLQVRFRKWHHPCRAENRVGQVT